MPISFWQHLWKTVRLALEQQSQGRNSTQRDLETSIPSYVLIDMHPSVGIYLNKKENSLILLICVENIGIYINSSFRKLKIIAV